MIIPTNSRILVQLSAEEYKSFTTDPNRGIFRGIVYSSSEGPFSESPVATDGGGSYSWVRRPTDSNLKNGDEILFSRDGMCVPVAISESTNVVVSPKESSSEELEDILHLVLIEESHIFGLIK
jgi:hypothetical protein